MDNMKDQVVVVFSYQAGSITPSVLADIIEYGIGFEGNYLRSSFEKIKNGNCSIKNRLKAIRESKSYDFCTFQLNEKKDEDCPRLFIHQRNTYDHLKMRFHAGQLPNGEFFNRLASIEGFNFGYIEDYEFNYWQNAERLCFYEMRNVPHHHLPKKSNGMPYPLEEDIVDISLNFGRDIEYPGVLFAIAPTMWVNKSFISNVCPAFLSNMSPFVDVKNITENICCLKLCDDLKPNSADIEKIERIAKDINFSVFEAEGKELIKFAPSDPMFEINNIDLKGEKCREYVVWVDDQRKQTKKSKAKTKLVNVFNSKGDRVNAYSEEIGK
jgi:hypothetical protein